MRVTPAFGMLALGTQSVFASFFVSIHPAVEKLRDGYDPVTEDVSPAPSAPGAVPWSHRGVSNPALTFTRRMFSHPPGILRSTSTEPHVTPA